MPSPTCSANRLYVSSCYLRTTSYRHQQHLFFTPRLWRQTPASLPRAQSSPVVKSDGDRLCPADPQPSTPARAPSAAPPLCPGQPYLTLLSARIPSSQNTQTQEKLGTRGAETEREEPSTALPPNRSKVGDGRLRGIESIFKAEIW